MKKRYLSIILAGSALLNFSSCGGDTTDQSTTTDTVAVEPEGDMLGFGAEGGDSYAVPSPNELFAIIKEGKLTYKDGLISTEAVNYTSSKEQALNFGRLTADIAYTASYEKFQESITNFDNLRKVGDDLGISYVFDELIVNRVKNNMDNADSLEVISTSSYLKIISELEGNEKGSTLAIIAAGGFVESVYILSQLIDTYDAANPVIQRLADQRFVMENVIAYLHKYRDEARIEEVLTELTPISDVFLNLDEEMIKEGDRSGDKVVLGGTRVIMTADEFNALKEASKTYRNAFSHAVQGQ